jgi:hypothetical protein
LCTTSPTVNELSSYSVFKLETLATRGINHAASVGTPLSLVLLLSKALALGDDQLGVRAVGVIVGNVGVTCEVRVDFDVGLDALESIFDVAPLRLGGVCGRRASLALVVGRLG